MILYIMIFFIKLVKIFYNPIPKFWNIYCELQFECDEHQLIAEFFVVAFNKKQAESIGSDLVSTFNYKHNSNFELKNVWKLKPSIDKNKECSDKLKQFPNILITQNQLKSLVYKNSYNVLKSHWDYVLITEGRQRAIKKLL